MLMLAEDPVRGMNGAEIMRAGVPQGSTYTTLNRMIDKGYVWSYRQPRDDGPPFRYYALTENGKRAAQLVEMWRQAL